MFELPVAVLSAMVTSESEITDATGAHVVTTTSVLVVGEGDA